MAVLLLYIGYAVSLNILFAIRYDPQEISRSTFLFSTFTRQMLRHGGFPVSNHEKKNPVFGDMVQTLNRLFPPGANIEELEKFFENLGERENRNFIWSIERRYSDKNFVVRRGKGEKILFLSDDYKLKTSKVGKRYDFSYRFRISYTALIYNPLYIINCTGSYIYTLSVETNDGRIKEINADLFSTDTWW